MGNRAAKYAAIKAAHRSESSALIIAHVRRTPKGRIRLFKVGIVLKGGREETISKDLPEDDARLAFEDQYDVRKAVHDIVKKSGRFSKFYDSIVKLTYHEKD